MGLGLAFSRKIFSDLKYFIICVVLKLNLLNKTSPLLVMKISQSIGAVLAAAAGTMEQAATFLGVSTAKGNGLDVSFVIDRI